jgi:hypothetical protein
MAQNPDIGIWQYSAPRSDKCCLCGQPGEQFRVEHRPTGRGGMMQAWPFCSRCWEACQGDGVDPRLYRVLLHAIFQHDPGHTQKNVESEKTEL